MKDHYLKLALPVSSLTALDGWQEGLWLSLSADEVYSLSALARVHYDAASLTTTTYDDFKDGVRQMVEAGALRLVSGSALEAMLDGADEPTVIVVGPVS
jgi:hypothetical protein